MSSKLRLVDLSFEQDDMDDDYMGVQFAEPQRKKVEKSKRKKQGADHYVEQRSLKRDFDFNAAPF